MPQLQSCANGTRYNGPAPATATPNSMMFSTIVKCLTPAHMHAVASYVQGMR